MKKIFSVCAILLSGTVGQSYANLVALEQQELSQSLGQGAAEMSWTFSLNHQYANDLSKKEISKMGGGVVTEAYYGYQCLGGDTSCRLAISANNHVDKDGNKKWLVFKKIQGTLQIDQFIIDGTTLKNQYNKPQTALQITFKDAYPLKLRNFGFETMSVETGKETTVAGAEGYNNNQIYNQFTVKNQTNKEVTLDVPSFDKGHEQGFMGLNMHGNLHLNGSLKIFSFNCTGATGSRC